MAPNILKSSLESASFNIVFQVTCRFVTFFLNAFMVRRIDKDVLGVMNVRLLLLESMILFLSKEPFKKACISNTANHNWAQVVNLLWLAFPIGAFMSLFFGYIWLYVLQTSETLPPYYDFAVYAFALSCMIELSSLVVELVAEAFLFIRLKIIIESIMITVRTSIFILMILYNSENALLAFGVAQLLASIFYTGGYYVYFYFYIKRVKRHKLKRRLSMSDDGLEEYVESEFPFTTIKDFLPGQLENNDFYLDKNLSKLTWTFFKQGTVKQVLTEGERLIMTFSEEIFPADTKIDLVKQGEYEVVNNLGSLAARFIFRPIEDSSYFYFTQMIQRDVPITLQNSAKIQESTNVLKYVCSVITSLGLMILVFGQSYSSLLLWLYGGDKLTTSLPVLLLQVHCLAVLLLGINGITECYTNATADSNTIQKNNRNMIFTSIAFLIASIFFVWLLGPVGFILGNCVNMSFRIFHSSKFILSRYSESKYQPLLGLIPKPIFSCSLVLAGLVTHLTKVYYFPDDKFFHLFIGALMFGLVCCSWAYENQDLIKLGCNKWFERRDRTDKSE